jgi:transposase
MSPDGIAAGQIQVFGKVFSKPWRKNADNEYAMIDATIVRRISMQRRRLKRGRRYQGSLGARKNRSQQRWFDDKNPCPLRLPAKAGAQDRLVDALGNPMEFILTPGKACDLEGADAILTDLITGGLLANKAFDTNKRVLERLGQKNIIAVIPPKSNRKIQRDYDKALYKVRHLIENFILKLKQFRAIATRYDKTAQNFLGAIFLAGT